MNLMQTSHFYFLISLMGFLLGPVLHYLFFKRKNANFWMDGFSLASVGGIVLVHLLPEAIEKGGMIAFVLILIGVFLPSFLTGWMGRFSETGEKILLVGGMYLHALTESAALGSVNERDTQALGLAIVLHKLPMGLLLFSFLLRDKGFRFALFTILGVSTTSCVGYALGNQLLSFFPPTYSLYLEIFVSASLLHVAFDAHPASSHNHDDHIHTEACNHTSHDHVEKDLTLRNIFYPTTGHLYSTIGAVFGIALVSGLMGQPRLGRIGGSYSLSFLDTFLSLALESAPALLVAYTFSGLIKSFLPDSGVHWLKKGGSVIQSLKGVLFGLPLPICSCGVLPIYESLLKRGVPVTSSIGFLIATPELGIDALLISIPLLGGELSVVRLIVAFLVAMGASLLMERVLPKNNREMDFSIHKEEKKSLSLKLQNGFEFGFVELFDHTIPWILVGLFLSAVIEPIFEYGFFSSIPEFLQVPLFALIGIPFYVCATGATPLAAIAIHKGISSGAALAFLIAGPATNLTTFGLLSKLHSKRSAFYFGFFVTSLAVALGWIVNALPIRGIDGFHALSEGETNFYKLCSLYLISFLLLLSLLRQGPRGMIKQLTSPIHTHG
jgi:uncharacterized protein